MKWESSQQKNGLCVFYRFKLLKNTGPNYWKIQVQTFEKYRSKLLKNTSPNYWKIQVQTIEKYRFKLLRNNLRCEHFFTGNITDLNLYCHLLQSWTGLVWMVKRTCLDSAALVLALVKGLAGLCWSGLRPCSCNCLSLLALNHSEPVISCSDLWKLTLERSV